MPEGTRFVVWVDGPTPDWVLHVLTQEQCFVARFLFRGRVPPEARARVADVAMRTNAGLLVGCFELDMDTGELSFRSGVFFAGTELVEYLVANVIMSAMDKIERHAGLFAEVSLSIES